MSDDAFEAALRRPDLRAEGWRPLGRVRPWKAKLGERLTGVYRGRVALQGAFGPYGGHDVDTGGGVYRITGCDAEAAFERALVGGDVLVECVEAETFTDAAGARRVRRAWQVYEKEPTE